MAITNDSDMPILAGGEFIALKDYTTDGKMTMVSTTKSTLTKAMEYLSDESKKSVKLTDAKYPIFEGVESRKIRALMMVMLGCDVYGPGMKSIGPPKLAKELKVVKERLSKHNQQISDDAFYNALIQHVGTHTGLGTEVIETLVAGILYEPTNYVSASSTDGGLSAIVTEADYSYYDGVIPVHLPEYLSDFMGPQTAQNNIGPTILLCKGVGDRSHLFLGKTEWNLCHSCNKVVCKHCSEFVEETSIGDGNKTKHKHCLGCYASKRLVPNITNNEYYKRIDDMRKELKHTFKFDDVHELSFDEIEDAYDSALLSLANHKNHPIKYPVHPTSELESPSSWKHVFNLEFCQGGAFVSDPAVREHIPELLKLLATCVTYEEKKHTDWVKDPSVYDALPAHIISFAKGSRFDSGYRLIERCVRHGHDPRMPSMFNNTAEVVQLDDGSLGLVIKSFVPASMKKEVYRTTVAFSAQDLLAVECNCKSGSKGDDNVTCVH
eukprot:scaffold251008_cov83-Cyclotella_meneghiniana.AAC.1